MNKKEFAKRRQRLIEIMGEDSIAVLPNAKVATRNRDVDYIFRSDSNFHYLSGFDEPQSVVVIVPGRPHGEYLLFCFEGFIYLPHSIRFNDMGCYPFERLSYWYELIWSTIYIST